MVDGDSQVVVDMCAPMELKELKPEQRRYANQRKHIYVGHRDMRSLGHKAFDVYYSVALTK